MNISVLAVIAEYDRKAANYGKEVSIADRTKEEMKKEMKISTFSNNDDLNCCNKRTSCEKKVGDQRSIVDYINFYPVGDDKTEKQNFDVLAAPYDRAFVVAPEKNQEFKDSEPNPEVRGQIEEKAKCLRRKKRKQWWNQWKR